MELDGETAGRVAAEGESKARAWHVHFRVHHGPPPDTAVRAASLCLRLDLQRIETERAAYGYPTLHILWRSHARALWARAQG
jgi:hypothetical protein